MRVQNYFEMNSTFKGTVGVISSNPQCKDDMYDSQR